MPVEQKTRALFYSYNKHISEHLSHCSKVPKSGFSPKQDVSTKLTEMGYYTKRSRDESSSSLSISSSCRCTNEKKSHYHCPHCDGKYLKWHLKDHMVKCPEKVIPISSEPSLEKDFDTKNRTHLTWNNSNQVYKNNHGNIYVGCNVNFGDRDFIPKLPGSNLTISKVRDGHSNKNDNSEKFHISPKKDANGTSKISTSHSDSQINNDEPSPHSTTPSNNKNISQEDALPSEIRIKIPGEECKKLLKGRYSCNGRDYLPSNWTDFIAQKLGEIQGFHCCIKFLPHFIPRKDTSLYHFSCDFTCSIAGCQLKGSAELIKDYSLSMLGL